MAIKRMLAVTGAVAAATLLSAPAAQAEEAAPQAAPAQAEAQADGYLHVYTGYNGAGWCDSWKGNSGDWGVCRNRVSSLWNNGYPGNYDDVWVYWGLNHSGARRGVYNGVALNDLRKWDFDANTGAGSGQALNNNISSHQWTNLP
ncbi:hypothetical protein [Nocardiopsis suaedae]|uniref:Peptidase inhibitor family I36 protein n=1 Tax=Nocardiopsis suaedae TaxID=3018444 RepID=A0ABT4TG32_9ACTN|nr:hypothetical protein [Nocardiopsis suaedae]MDA2803672.1 hypothetical protein [Nocardiopsis suaedae]